MTLRTRKPTGAVPWPLILIEGGEKSGKSWACAALTASPKVGRALWLDLNEGAADEYGAIPGADYEVLDHNGTWASIIGQVAEAKAEAQRAAAAGERPVVLIVDSVTAEWDLQKDWASARAAGSDANKARLARDPGAEIKVSMNLWNDATARHRRLMTLLMTFPGIVVMTARGKEVASLDDNGRPIEGTKEYKVEGHKTLAYDASCWLRLFRGEPGLIVGGRSVHLQFRPGDKPRELADDWSLEGIIFDVLQCDPVKAHVRDLTPTRPVASAVEIRDEALATTTDADRIGELWRDAKMAYADTVLDNEHGDAENLVALLERVGAERRGNGTSVPARPAERQQPAQRPAAQPAPPAAVPGRAADGDGEDQWVAKFNVALGSSTSPDSLIERAKDVRAARREGVISVEITNELLDQVAAAKRNVAVPA